MEFLIISLVKVVLVVLVIFTTVANLVYAERRISAAIQDRIEHQLGCQHAAVTGDFDNVLPRKRPRRSHHRQQHLVGKEAPRRRLDHERGPTRTSAPRLAGMVSRAPSLVGLRFSAFQAGRNQARSDDCPLVQSEIIAGVVEHLLETGDIGHATQIHARQA